MKNSLKLIALAFLLCINSTVAFSADSIAYVMKSQNMPDYPAGHKMPENTVIKTTGNQRLALKTNTGDTVIVGKNSIFKLVEPGFFNQVFGKIYYYIKSRNANRSLRVRSTVATLGVRGTKFIISSDEQENGQISLAEGLLNIESNDDEPFAVTSKKKLTAFERYKLESLKEMQSINDEYENYKKQINQEFTEYKNSFELTANTTLSFEGKKVGSAPISSDQKEDMLSFESFIEDIAPEDDAPEEDAP